MFPAAGITVRQAPKLPPPPRSARNVPEPPTPPTALCRSLFSLASPRAPRNPKKTLDNPYTHMLTSAMLARQIPLPHPPRRSNSFAPMLLQPLSSLFASLSLCFQQLAASFRKTPGVGGYPNTSASRFASAVMCATWRFYPLCPHSIAHTSRHHGRVPPPIFFLAARLLRAPRGHIR